MLAALIILLVVVADQITKYLATTLLAPIHKFPIIDGVLEFLYTRNRGAAWGILADKRWVFMTISVVSIVLMTIYLVYACKKGERRLFTSAIALIIGGGVGNMIDRIFYEEGAVVDFIYFKLIDFPVFNIADCAVTIGAGLLIIYIIYFEIIKPAKQNKKTLEEKADGKTDMQ